MSSNRNFLHGRFGNINFVSFMKTVSYSYSSETDLEFICDIFLYSLSSLSIVYKKVLESILTFLAWNIFTMLTFLAWKTYPRSTLQLLKTDNVQLCWLGCASLDNVLYLTCWICLYFYIKCTIILSLFSLFNFTFH